MNLVAKISMLYCITIMYLVQAKGLRKQVKELKRSVDGFSQQQLQVTRTLEEHNGSIEALEDQVEHVNSVVSECCSSENDTSKPCQVQQVVQQIGQIEENVHLTREDIAEVRHVIDDVANELKASFDAIQCQVAEARPKTCLALLKAGLTISGVYEIYLGPCQEPVQVYCDQETDGGGWTVFQRRKDGSVNFYRGWFEYEQGFGSLDGEFWLGNENVNRLMFAKCCYELRVDLEDFENNKRYAKFNNFMVGPKSENYKLTAEGYTGDAGDSLTVQSGRQFSTKDSDHDTYAGSCAQLYKGGWWYSACHHSNLNGLYHIGNHETYADGINWYHWKGHYYSLEFTEMKFRERIDN